MNIQTALYAWLTAQAGVSALVGDRLYPLRLPQKCAYPAIRYERDNTDRSTDHDGQGDLLTTDLQLDSVATTLAAAVNVADAVRSALLNYSGAMGDLHVYRVELVADFETWDQTLEAYRASQAWTIWHN